MFKKNVVVASVDSAVASVDPAVASVDPAKVVRGSIRELHEVLSSSTCRGDVETLLAAFPNDSIFCFQRRKDFPLALATALTPFHTGRITEVDGNHICEVDCGGMCKDAPPFI